MASIPEPSREVLTVALETKRPLYSDQFDGTLDARLAERTRIARDLHDTLLQSFHGLLLRFQTALEQLPPQAKEARQTLAQAINQAAKAIIEGREAVQGLRATVVDTNDLALSFRIFSDGLAANIGSAAAPSLTVIVVGAPRVLHPLACDEIYRIGCEALRNAFQHAAASKVEVELCYDNRQFRLRVRDDGKGIEAEFLGEQACTGHFGLQGMRERADLVGGKLTVWSALNSGTEVELSIPQIAGGSLPRVRSPA